MFTAISTSFAFDITLFFIGLYIGRYLNSPFIYRGTCLLSSISTILLYTICRLQQPTWFTQHPLLGFILSGYDISLSLKFIELAFGFPWTYIQKMPLKLTLMYLLAFPSMPETEEKLAEISKEDVRHEAYPSIMLGILQLIVHRTILYFTPLEWLTLPLSSSPFMIAYCRCFLLCFILYLSIDLAGNLGFTFYSVVFNIRMRPVFPAFPFLSTSLRDFWSYRWNNMVKVLLHRVSFVALPKILPINNAIKGLCAFALSGVIHEYTILFVSGRLSGKNMLFFLSQGLLVLFEIVIKLSAKPTTSVGKFKGWLWTIGMLIIPSPLFFDPFIESGVFSSMK